MFICEPQASSSPLHLVTPAAGPAPFQKHAYTKAPLFKKHLFINLKSFFPKSFPSQSGSAFYLNYAFYYESTEDAQAVMGNEAALPCS